MIFFKKKNQYKTKKYLNLHWLGYKLCIMHNKFPPLNKQLHLIWFYNPSKYFPIFLSTTHPQTQLALQFWAEKYLSKNHPFPKRSLGNGGWNLSPTTHSIINHCATCNIFFKMKIYLPFNNILKVSNVRFKC